MANVSIDFKLLFESLPGLYLILAPDLQIAAVSNSYLEATMTDRQKIIGQNLFEVFPDNPHDTAATGEANLRASLNFVLQNKQPHSMAVQKYDIRTPTGEFEERYWSPLNKPVLDERGDLLYIIHRVEDATEFIRLKEKESKRKIAADLLQVRADDQEIEIYKRAQEIQKINQQLLMEIADRKTAEEDVEHTRILLHSTLESLQNILIFSIDKDYRYLNFNAAFKNATFHAYGTTVAVGGILMTSITNEHDRDRIKSNCDRSLSGENHTTIQEYGDIHKRFFETHYNPVRNDVGEIVGVTVFSADVTQRLQSEEKVQALNKELEAFTYTVAHDLRAPLRIIDGYSSILAEDYVECLSNDGKRITQVISTNVHRMGRLIDDLLNFSRLGKLSVSKRNTDMNHLLKEVVEEQLAHVDRNRIELKIGSLEPADCDSNLMRQVLHNLVSNAIKYSSKKDKSLIEIDSYRDNGDVVYFVKDNGSGFDMQYADKLFGVFQRLHRITEFEGTGVGLAIVHRIIEKHGGKIWANSRVDDGATFFFSIQR
jgi:PAS domain S-box-containing protein